MLKSQHDLVYVENTIKF